MVWSKYMSYIMIGVTVVVYVSVSVGVYFKTWPSPLRGFLGMRHCENGGYPAAPQAPPRRPP